MRKYFIFVMLVMAPLWMLAQVSVERSSEIVEIGNAKYYMHHVKAGQTLYSISKVYNVSVDEITRLNPEVANVLKVNSVIGIPVVDGNLEDEPTAETQEPTAETQEPIVVAQEPTAVAQEVTQSPQEQQEPQVVDDTYVVENGEDLYDIAKKFGIDVAEFKAINTGLDNYPAAGTVIKVPAIVNEDDYIVHVVEEQERTSSLLKRWDIDGDEFRQMNMSVGSRVFVGQVVLIPIEPVVREMHPMNMDEPEEENTEPQMPQQGLDKPIANEMDEESVAAMDDTIPERICLIDPANATARYHVALLVPLYLDEVANINVKKEELMQAEKARSLSFLQFYEGFMMAVDSLVKTQGLHLDLTVIDVTERVSTANAAIAKLENSDCDLIVGPFFSKSFAVVASYAKEKGIVIVNPLSTREGILDGYPNVVKVKPNLYGQINEVVNLVRNQYSDANVFIVSQEKVGDTLYLNEMERQLTMAINKVSDTNVVGRYSYNELQSMVDKFSGVRNNFVVAYGDNNVFATQVLNGMKKSAQGYPITLVALPEWDKFEKLSVETLLQMNAIYMNAGFVDYSDESISHFVLKFRKKYNVEPLDYAFEGFDVAWYFLNALMRYGADMVDCLPSCNIPLTRASYLFVSTGADRGLENCNWKMYQYDSESIELQPVDPFQPNETIVK